MGENTKVSPTTEAADSPLLLSLSVADGSSRLYSIGALTNRSEQLCTLPHPSDANSPGYIIGTVNGLLCYFDGKSLLLYNPSTQQVKRIPTESLFHTRKSNLDSFLYTPYSSGFSFGFDATRKVFQIVHVSGYACRGESKLEFLETRVFTIRASDILSQTSCTWRMVEASLPYPYPFRTKGVFVDGSIYWLGTGAMGEPNIVEFHLASERFRLVSPPACSSVSKLSDVGGMLGLMSFKDHGDGSLELWVYEGSTWVKKNAGHCVYKKKKGVHPVFPVVVGNGKLLTSRTTMHSFAICTNFVLHSIEDGSEKVVRILGLPYWLSDAEYKKANLSVFNYEKSGFDLGLVLQLGDFEMDVATVEPNKVPLIPLVHELPTLLPHKEVARTAWTPKETVVFVDVLNLKHRNSARLSQTSKVSFPCFDSCPRSELEQLQKLKTIQTQVTRKKEAEARQRDSQNRRQNRGNRHRQGQESKEERTIVKRRNN